LAVRLHAQASIRTAHDSGQQRQETLEVVAFERRNVEDRAGEHVAGRDRLHALRWRRGRPHLDARRNERQADIGEDLSGLAGANVERPRVGRDEPRPCGLDDVAPDRNVWKCRLPRSVSQRPGEHHIAIERTQLHVDAGNPHRSLERRDRGNNTSRVAGTLRTGTGCLESDTVTG